MSTTRTSVRAKRGMLTGEQMLGLLKLQGMTVRGFADLTGLHERTAQTYRRGEQPVPQWVELVLALLVSARRAGVVLRAKHTAEGLVITTGFELPASCQNAKAASLAGAWVATAMRRAATGA